MKRLLTSLLQGLIKTSARTRLVRHARYAQLAEETLLREIFADAAVCSTA